MKKNKSVSKINFLFSGNLMGFLLILFAIAMAKGTFIENDFNAEAAKLLVYNSWWFEALLALLCLNFAGMIYTKQLYKRSKVNVLVLHLAFVVILIGAGITRYYGVEGYMHIRNGDENNTFSSAEDYISVHISKGNEEVKLNKRIFLTNAKNDLYKGGVNLGDEEIIIEVKNFIPNAVSKIISDNSSPGILSVVVADQNGRSDYDLQEGQHLPLDLLTISFGLDSGDSSFQIENHNGALNFIAPVDINHVNMSTGHEETLVANTLYPLALMTIYQINELNILFKEFKQSGSTVYEPGPDDQETGVEVLSILATINGEPHLVKTVKTQDDYIHDYHGTLGNLNFEIHIGPQSVTIPYKIKLDEFKLDRYPGSESPSSYASYVTLIDTVNNKEIPYKIYMNNILNYGGYRFFQSSYDADEQGTVLSVNKDFWGTLISYTGYGLLFLSLILSLFIKNSRFSSTYSRLAKNIKANSNKVKIIVIAIISSVMAINSTSTLAQTKDLDLIETEHIKKFNQLLIQKNDGRIIPANTLAEEILVKIYKSSSYNGMGAPQVLLEMTSNIKVWQEEPIIKVKSEYIQNLLGINSKYASFKDFLNEEGKYKISKQVNQAYSKSPGKRNTNDKDLIAVDDQANVAYLVFNGNFFKIFPLINETNQSWGTQFEYLAYVEEQGLNSEVPKFTDYISQLSLAKTVNDYTKPNEMLESIIQFQRNNGGEFMPSKQKIGIEIWYNKIHIFKRLIPYYFLFGILLLGAFLIKLLKPSVNFTRLTKIIRILLVILFIAHTLGLIARWYIAGHAPWSNGYESMIYIAWATLLAGFIFKQNVVSNTAVSAILSGIILFTAHLSWLNPEITNLVPVLKSYWLTIHVATITASYGFFALAAMLGFLNLLLMIMRNKKNYSILQDKIQELSSTIELALSIGLVLLVIGNFLGGVWANESWGRYWGWDPKETWAMISIIVYTFILHSRLIPKLGSIYFFNLFALVGFGSILMTYFGVNYYLSGLHSYAGGDSMPIPDFLYYTIGILGAVGILAAYNEFILKKSELAK